MIGADLLTIFNWWSILFLVGLGTLPITISFFGSFFDRGYIFSKIIGILLISYASWILASLKILPFTQTILVMLFIILVLANCYYGFRQNLKSILNIPLKTFIFEEIIFLIGLIFWSLIRGFDPTVHGLEKFMDFGFTNSILRSNYFPPLDLWLTPYYINYYYFGHLVTAVLTKLSGINPAISYNLMVASLFSLTLAGSFSIGANLYHLLIPKPLTATIKEKRQILISGLLSAFLVTFAGNLHTIYLFFKSYTPAENPTPFWNLSPLLNFSGYWYPNATRFIPFTIHEFPLYSFVVSDLHGHVLDIPFVLLLIAVLIKIFHQARIKLIDYITLSFLIAIFLMTNVLDGPIYLILISLVLFVMMIRNQNVAFNQTIDQGVLQKLVIGVRNTFKSVGIIVLSAVVLSLPFWIFFKPFGSGIGVLCVNNSTDLWHLGPLLFEPNHCQKSPLWMLLILWGFPLYLFSIFMIFIHQKKNQSSHFATQVLIPTLAIFALILIVIPEFFYIKDIYPAHYRANTIFKFGYQAFIIFGLIGGFMMTRLIVIKKTPFLALFGLFVLFFLVAIYPYFAINSYYGSLTGYKGLNGLNYLSDLYPTDYKGIVWLQNNISEQPVILEAQGDSYTDYARVSSNTGLPTVLGWPVHEWLWRGAYGAATANNKVTDLPAPRIPEVGILYESSDLTETQNLIKKYHIQYVFVGNLERQKYLNLHEEKFSQLGKIVFQDGLTTIYRIN